MSARANAHFSLQQTGTHVWFLQWRPMKESWCVHLKLRHPQRHPSQSSKGRRWAPSHLLSGSNNNLANWRWWFSQKSEPIPNAEIIWNLSCRVCTVAFLSLSESKQVSRTLSTLLRNILHPSFHKSFTTWEGGEGTSISHQRAGPLHCDHTHPGDTSVPNQAAMISYAVKRLQWRWMQSLKLNSLQYVKHHLASDCFPERMPQHALSMLWGHYVLVANIGRQMERH